MFGGKDQVRTVGNDMADVYKALSYMTIGRSENRGTLQVTEGQGTVTLSCVNHHFLSCRNDFKDTNGMNATALRNLVKNAVNAELDAAFVGLKKVSLGLSDAETRALDEKFAKVKKAFENAIGEPNETGKHEFSRKVIGAILQRVDAIKESLSVQGLMRMDVDELISIADPRNPGNKREADSLKVLDREQARCKQTLYNKIDASSAKTNMVVAQKLLGGLVKEAKKGVKSQSEWIGKVLDGADKIYKGRNVAAKAGFLARRVVYDMLNPRGENGGPLVGLTRKERDELKTCAEGILDNLERRLNSAEKSGDIDESIESGVNALEVLLKAYKSRLDGDFIAAYNDTLADYDLEVLQLDDKGMVKPLGEDKVGQVRGDCKKLLDLLTATSDSDGQSAIGVDTSYKNRSKVEILHELDKEMNDVMTPEERVGVIGLNGVDREPSESDWGDDWEDAKLFNNEIDD